MERSEEQAARNESVFRDANEKIAERRAELDQVSGPTPFLCECENPACTEILRLSPDEYESVRAEPTQFVIAPGHPTNGVETELAGDGWVAVSKTGVGARVARPEDDR